VEVCQHFFWIHLLAAAESKEEPGILPSKPKIIPAKKMRKLHWPHLKAEEVVT
jgi:hypothetical protein